MAPSQRVVLSANSNWNIVNFRVGLIRALREAGYDPIVIAPRDAAVEERMGALQVDQIAVPIQRSGLNPWTDLKLLINYRRLLGKIRPTAYLGYTIKPNIYGSIAAASLGIPSIPNVSGLGTAFMRRGPLQSVVRRMYRFGFRRAPVVFFQNPEDRQLFLDCRIVRPDQARVLPGSGVDLKRFSPAPMPQGQPIFLLIARMLRDKGVIEFVEAARIIRQELPAARFQLLGPIDEGNRSAIRREEIDAWVAEGAVEYLGTADDVRPLITASTGVVLPSYREGLPRSLLEAGAIGRPLIAADVPGCRDVVEDGVNGYLCKVRDSRSLADAIKRLAVASPEARQAMGEAARNRVEQRFSEEFVIRAYLDVLASLNKTQSGIRC